MLENPLREYDLLSLLECQNQRQESRPIYVELQEEAGSEKGHETQAGGQSSVNACIEVALKDVYPLNHTYSIV